LTAGFLITTETSIQLQKGKGEFEWALASTTLRNGWIGTA